MVLGTAKKTGDITMKNITAMIVSASLLMGMSAVQAGDALYDIEVTGLQGMSINKGATVWQPEPVYPKMALRRGLTGEVLVEYDINEQGKAENIVILDASPRGFFNNATVRTLENTTFARNYEQGETAVLSGVKKRFVYQIVRDEQHGDQLALSIQ